MADRYQDRLFSSADQDRGESDPLAELARLIGQNDPLGAPAKPAPHPLQSRANVRPQQYDPRPQQYDPPEEPEFAPSPPAWMQRARHETPLPPVPPPLPQEYDDEPEYQPAPVHPLHRYAAAQPPQVPAHQAPPAQDYYEEPQQQYADEPQQDPSRYDDALYGRLETGEHDYQRDPVYPDDPYAYQGDEYEEEPAPKKRSSGLMTVAAVLALAVVGTGGAFAYRTFVGSPRSGEPPIIKADNSPTKVVPAPSDAGAAKTPDRMLPGDGGEKLVSREETPVDVNSRSGGPRVVFPPLNQNTSPPPVASVSPSGPPPANGANGTMPNNEPRRIRTLAVKGDAADNGGIPAGASAPPPRPAPPTRSVAAPATPAAASAPGAPPARNPASANASANSPMSLAPQAGESEPPTRVAATNPTQTAPAPEGGPSFLVSVTSQDSESAARESFRSAQGKYASVLGSRSPVIKRVDMPDGRVKYRAMVGPYRTRQEAVQFCTELKGAGGQCFIP
jgi:SPOR domain